MTKYAANIESADGTVRIAGEVEFTDPATQPLPLAGGTVTGATTFAGVVKATALPAADPHVAGELWANAGVVTVSAG